MGHFLWKIHSPERGFQDYAIIRTLFSWLASNGDIIVHKEALVLHLEATTSVQVNQPWFVRNSKKLKELQLQDIWCDK